MPRLKVFRWSDGFHAYSVAVSSRHKALEAWGSKQDLFSTGLASEIRDGPDFEAAMKSPGEVVKRGEAVDLGKITKAPKPRAAKGPSAAKKRKIEALERALEDIQAERDRVLSEMDEHIQRLEQDRAKASEAFIRRFDTAKGQLAKARRG